MDYDTCDGCSDYIDETDDTFMFFYGGRQYRGHQVCLPSLNRYMGVGQCVHCDDAYDVDSPFVSDNGSHKRCEEDWFQRQLWSITQGPLGRYNTTGVMLAIEQGFDIDKHIIDLRTLRNQERNGTREGRIEAENRVILSHPINFVDEEQAEAYFI